MSETKIIWKEGSGWQHRLREFVLRVQSVIGIGGADEAGPIFEYDEFLETKSIRGGTASVVMPGRYAFADTFEGRSSQYSDLQKILDNQINELNPLGEGASCALAQQENETLSRISLLFLRQDTIDIVETKAAEHGLQSLRFIPQADTERAFASPTSVAQAHTNRTSWIVALGAVFLSLWIGSSLLVAKSEAMLREVQFSETEWRAAASTRSAAAQQVSALESLAGLQADHQTVAVRLQELADLRDVMPEEAWWMQVSMNGNEIEVSGLAPNAPMVLKSVSEAYAGRRVSFAEPIIEEAGGQQSFVISIEGGS